MSSLNVDTSWRSARDQCSSVVPIDVTDVSHSAEAWNAFGLRLATTMTTTTTKSKAAKKLWAKVQTDIKNRFWAKMRKTDRIFSGENINFGMKFGDCHKSFSFRSRNEEKELSFVSNFDWSNSFLKRNIVWNDCAENELEVYCWPRLAWVLMSWVWIQPGRWDKVNNIVFSSHSFPLTEGPYPGYKVCCAMAHGMDITQTIGL